MKVTWGGLGRVLSSQRGLEEILEALGEVLGAFWVLKEVFGDYSGGWKASLKRIVELLKNPQKHCKVWQSSRSGRSQNQ